MSNVIRFLETIGRTPMSPLEYAASVSSLNVDSAQQQALLSCDHVTLSALLGGRPKVFFGIMADEEQEFSH